MDSTPVGGLIREKGAGKRELPLEHNDSSFVGSKDGSFSAAFGGPGLGE